MKLIHITKTGVIGIAIAAWFAQGAGGWRPIAMRALGSWISAIAVLSGGLALLHR